MKQTSCILILLLLAIWSVPLQGQSHETEARIRRIESDLLPGTVPSDGSVRPMDIRQRMAFHKVPGVSVAYFEDGKIQWTRTYGYASADSSRPVRPETLFQAASISKPVAATGALILAGQGKLELDTDVNRFLRTWQLPAGKQTEARPVTLRGLVTHTAGLTVHGFRGYAQGEPVPAVIQVLNGETPANSAPVRTDTLPGSIWRYSGGGYTVMQQMVQDVSGYDFAAFMEKKVLKRAGMRHSTYRQPLPPELHNRAATGFRSNGKPVEGNWHTYPEQAAAGLWTTPSDLARWAIAIQQAYNGQGNRVLSPALARQMLTRNIHHWGLGPGIEGAGDSLTFGHGGANEGFRCQLIAFARPGGPGVAIMTNSDSGDRLVRELLMSIDRAYGWNKYKTDTLHTISLPPVILDRYTGLYENSQEQVRIRIAREEDHLTGTLLWSGERITLRALSDTSFYSFDGQAPVRFVADKYGKVQRMVAWGSFELQRIADQ